MTLFDGNFFKSGIKINVKTVAGYGYDKVVFHT